jgi:hypothetical protein
MQVLCKSTNGNAEVYCSVCGQGFVMFWERQSRNERAECMHEIEKALRGHHREIEGREAHPQTGFLIPEWDGPIAFSGAAILGHAPTWAL